MIENLEVLKKIKQITDLRKLNKDELNRLTEEIRVFLVESVSKTGGHLSASLGVVELTVALYLEFNPFEDKIVWDVGHQAYVHKILTGRMEGFNTLRKEGGLSGFPKISESSADAFNTGHSSTSISAAAGFAAADMILDKKKYNVAVIGDGAMTGGMAYEALNHAGSSRLPLIVVLNDNGMSISKNVGGISKKLKEIRVAARYLKLKSNVKSTLDIIPVIGKPIKNFVSRFKAGLRAAVLPGVIFEDFGFKYMGPIDGHNIDAVREVLKQAKSMKEPVLIHVYTQKGKGYIPAEKNPDLYHGVSSFETHTGRINDNGGETWADAFGAFMCKEAESNKKLAAVTAAMPLGTGLSEFAAKYPNRFFDVAIAEQHAVTFSAAMAKAGVVPVAAIYSTFLQRAYDQILHDTSLMNLHVVFCVDRCGIVGSDGETHQGVYDIAYMYQMPSMCILSPAHKQDFIKMLDFGVNKCQGPVAVRYPRGKIPLGFGERENCIKCEDVTKSVLIKEGSDVLLVAVGITVYDCLKAAEILKEKGISAAVCDVRCVRPIDADFMTKHSYGKKVVSVEDGIITGGFGQQLSALLKKEVLNIGYPSCAIEQGTVEEIKKRFGTDSEGIAEKTEIFFKSGTVE